MNSRLHTLSFSLSLVSCFLAGSAWAQTSSYEPLPQMTVQAAPFPYTPGTSVIIPDEYAGTAHDGGQFLSLIPGVSGGRMGGHGIEPVIHGQQQTQLNILVDGAFIHGGCPNRMDPPASFAAVNSYDEVTVLKGYQTVQAGPGGTGGTVLFERKPYDFTGDQIQWSGKTEAGYGLNGNVRDGFVDVAAGNKIAQLRLNASVTRAHNYEDGSGNEVRGAFNSHTLNLMPTWNISDNTALTLGLERLRTDDALFEGAGMDAPLDESYIYRSKLTHKYDHDFMRAVTVEAYKSLVDHMMDNYSLRTNTGMKMRVPSESDTFGGKITADMMLQDIPFTLGIEHHDNNRDAKRYSGVPAAPDATTPQSYMWPDATIAQTGLFAEGEIPMAAQTRLKLGGRYDRVKAEANAADIVFGAISANTLYQNHYGYTATDQTEHNFGALARLEYDMKENTTLFAGISRSVRTADTTERFMAANSAAAAQRWVGNPQLEPEAHHQIDAGFSTEGKSWSFGAMAYYDDVNNFIMRDLARGQDGIVANSNEAVYRNIDATLAGGEIEGKWQISDVVGLDAALAYTYGNNDEDHDALAQIPPIEGHVAVNYGRNNWTIGSRMNFATQQNRIDNDTSMRDADKTPGYITLDLYADMEINPVFTVKLGVDNVLDHDYARHLNRSNAFDPTEIQVNEPGRAAWLRVSAQF
ncbi:MAG: TonB-dependent copper receptor [Rhodospirillales bacterium]|nr:TonB-dependent copper receptor [Rhodospirillales bacterium]